MIGERRAARSVRSLLEIQKCTSIEKSQCLCGFPLLSGCTSIPHSCTLSLILVHLYNNENPSVYAGLRHCCTLSYSKPWGPWPDWTSRLLAFRKGGSLRKSRVETSKVFAQAFFKRLAGALVPSGHRSVLDRAGRREGAAPQGLVRLQQTQEGRKGFRWKAFRREPSSGVP